MALERRDTLINDGNVCRACSYIATTCWAYRCMLCCYCRFFFFFSLFRIICAAFRRQLVSNFQGTLRYFTILSRSVVYFHSSKVNSTALENVSLHTDKCLVCSLLFHSGVPNRVFSAIQDS